MTGSLRPDTGNRLQSLVLFVQILVRTDMCVDLFLQRFSALRQGTDRSFDILGDESVIGNRKVVVLSLDPVHMVGPSGLKVVKTLAVQLDRSGAFGAKRLSHSA